VRGKATELLLVIIVAYFAIGLWLSRKATAHLKDPKRLRIFTVMGSPEEFTDEGNRLRATANRFWLLGGLVTGAALFLL
jgi:hypothetical protein